MKRSTTNFTNRLSIALSICFSLTIGMSQAQELDSTMIDGKRYYIYPFKQSVAVHSDYYSCMKTAFGIKRRSYNAYRSIFSDDIESFMTRREYRKFIRSMKGFNMYGNDRKYINGKFKKAVRKNPYPLIEQRYTINNDIIPYLDPLPDGDYIQLYESVCIVNEKGECEEEVDTNYVAGYFSIQNNILHGEATWINLKGDTLKHGWFENGLKVGEWKIERRKIDYMLSKWDAEQYIEKGYPDIDTTIEYITYANGAQNGRYRLFEQSNYPIEEGHYTNGEASGEWLFRRVQYKGVGFARKRDRNNNMITRRYTYADKEDTTVVKLNWIRNGLITVYDADPEQFDFLSKYSVIDPVKNLYLVNFAKEEVLELDEEIDRPEYGYSEHSEYGYGYGYGYDYGYDYMYEGGYELEEDRYSYSRYDVSIWDPDQKEYIQRSKLIDSLGLRPAYQGVMEEYYPNGQLAYRYEFEDGVLKVEDTVFWDNGQAHDVIVYQADSNQYVRTIYDYSGKEYRSLTYDSVGNYIWFQDNQVYEPIIIEGLEVEGDSYVGHYYYNVYDTLAAELDGSTLLYRSWNKQDSVRVYDSQYEPTKRVLNEQTYGATGYIFRDAELTFGDDYESWTGKRHLRIDDMELVTTTSGALYDYDEDYKDSIPQRNVRYYRDRFDQTNVYQLFKNGTPYTGLVELDFAARKYSNSSKEIKLGLPHRYYTSRKLSKDLDKYREKGKMKYKVMFDFLDGTETGHDVGDKIYSNLFSSLLSNVFYPGSSDYYYDSYYYDYDYDRKLKKPETPKYPQIEVIEGQMVEGKPDGYWVAYDQYGEKVIEASYSKGELDGTMNTYSMEFPVDKPENDWDWAPEPKPWDDSIPEKRTHYLSETVNYKAGKKQGVQIEYNWLGEIVGSTSYTDGNMDGPTFERNKLAHTQMNYSDGLLDGYVQTYLTLPEKDSMLLYDLNFQDGALSGESKAYHTNGKLAKRGFFLDGEPIEDYEAYDTLGFKYHYVKFQYSFPVEEKIWEENKLSVRYLFDWEDSIYFVPSDITSSQSLESIMYKLGLGDYYLQQPYYGRRSLVSKHNIKYHMTKYYPNDTIARDGGLDGTKKVGNWKFYAYEGELLYEVDYFDTILMVNDSIKFKSKGILTDYDTEGKKLYESYIIEKFEKYDCAHTDHYEIRQLKTIWEADSSIGRMDGYVQNFYDNGTIQSEGQMKDGIPTGFWKIYDPFGKLNQYGQYFMGKRNGRWLSGDLSKTKYLGDICLNPNLPDLEEEIKYRENLLDITIINYQLGKALNKQFYDVDMNRFRDLDEEEEGAEE